MLRSEGVAPAFLGKIPRPVSFPRGFPGLSSLFVSGVFCHVFARKSRDGLLRLVIPVRFGFLLALFRPENPKTDWDDKPGLPRLVIPVRFGSSYIALFRPGLSSQSGLSLGFPCARPGLSLGLPWALPEPPVRYIHTYKTSLKADKEVGG